MDLICAYQRYLREINSVARVITQTMEIGPTV